MKAVFLITSIAECRRTSPNLFSKEETKGDVSRSYVYRAGLPFLAVSVYHYERNATKP